VLYILVLAVFSLPWSNENCGPWLFFSIPIIFWQSKDLMAWFQKVANFNVWFLGKILPDFHTFSTPDSKKQINSSPKSIKNIDFLAMTCQPQMLESQSRVLKTNFCLFFFKEKNKIAPCSWGPGSLSPSKQPYICPMCDITHKNSNPKLNNFLKSKLQDSASLQSSNSSLAISAVELCPNKDYPK